MGRLPTAFVRSILNNGHPGSNGSQLQPVATSWCSELELLRGAGGAWWHHLQAAGCSLVCAASQSLSAHESISCQARLLEQQRQQQIQPSCGSVSSAPSANLDIDQQLASRRLSHTFASSSSCNTNPAHSASPLLSSRQAARYQLITPTWQEHQSTGAGGPATTRSASASHQQMLPPGHSLFVSRNQQHTQGYQPLLAQQHTLSQRRSFGTMPQRSKAMTLDEVVRRHRKGMSTGFHVIEIHPGGTVVEPSLMVRAQELGIPYRDSALFSTENRATDQKAAILVRQGSILFKTEAVRAVISTAKAYIVKAKAFKSYSAVVEPVRDAVAQDDNIPFELNVLEALLHVTVVYFDNRIRHLTTIIDSIMKDVNNEKEPFSAVYNDVLIQQLAPLEKAITSVRNDARESLEAIREVLNDEDTLHSICLSAAKADAAFAATLRETAGDSGLGPSFPHPPGPGSPLQPPTTCSNSCSSNAAPGMGANNNSLPGASPGAAASGGVNAAPSAQFTAPGVAATATTGQQVLGTCVTPLGGAGLLVPPPHPHAARLPNVLDPLDPEAAEYASDKEQTRRMLQSYEREFDSIMGKLEEMGENLEATKESWAMKLDSARNHIILLNLRMTLASLCFMISTLFPTFGGMNIAHGLPDNPVTFWSVCGFSIVVGVALYPACTAMYKGAWRRRTSADMHRFHILRSFLVQHMDDLDEIIDAIKKLPDRVTRREFKMKLRDALPNTRFSSDSLNFLFNQYDVNRDGLLEKVEIARRETQALYFLESGMPDTVLNAPEADELLDPENHHEGHWWSDLMAGKKKKEKKEKHRNWLAGRVTYESSDDSDDDDNDDAKRRGKGSKGAKGKRHSEEEHASLKKLWYGWKTTECTEGKQQEGAAKQQQEREQQRQ